MMTKFAERNCWENMASLLEHVTGIGIRTHLTLAALLRYNGSLFYKSGRLDAKNLHLF
jgi:hypothetical protein